MTEIKKKRDYLDKKKIKEVGKETAGEQCGKESMEKVA